MRDLLASHACRAGDRPANDRKPAANDVRSPGGGRRPPPQMASSLRLSSAAYAVQNGRETGPDGRRSPLDYRPTPLHADTLKPEARLAGLRLLGGVYAAGVARCDLPAHRRPHRGDGRSGPHPPWRRPGRASRQSSLNWPSNRSRSPQPCRPRPDRLALALPRRPARLPDQCGPWANGSANSPSGSQRLARLPVPARHRVARRSPRTLGIDITAAVKWQRAAPGDRATNAADVSSGDPQQPD